MASLNLLTTIHFNPFLLSYLNHVRTWGDKGAEYRVFRSTERGVPPCTPEPAVVSFNCFSLLTINRKEVRHELTELLCRINQHGISSLC